MPEWIAVTRGVSPRISECELTHIPREPISFERATAQHRQYEEALKAQGCALISLPADAELPDSVFVEDTAVVLDEVAVITRPGAASRRPETDSMAALLETYRPLCVIHAPGTVDGGDVLCVDSTIYIGESERTNREGIAQMRAALSPFGYRVVPVKTRGCLHLKTAVTRVADDALLVNPQWVDGASFIAMRRIDVDPAEPFAGNALRLGEAVIHPAQFPLTRRRLEVEGLRVVPVDSTELAKAEAGVTCCSLVFRAR